MENRFTKETIVQDALDMGFSHAGLVDVSTLEARSEVRDMCAADKCHGYNKNWSCPPGCGTVDECNERMREYDWGIITQITLDMEDAMDMEAWTDAAARLHEGQVKLNEELHKRYDDVLALGGAGCRICSECTYPDKPCRFPEKRMSGMEAYGLVVSDVCSKNGLKYYYGPDTITFSGMFLIKERKCAEADRSQEKKERNATMRYFVNDACIGCGLCAGTCPEVFSMSDAGVAVAIEEDVPEGALDSAAEAMDGCPVAAIEEA